MLRNVQDLPQNRNRRVNIRILLEGCHDDVAKRMPLHRPGVEAVIQPLHEILNLRLARIGKRHDILADVTPGSDVVVLLQNPYVLSTRVK